MTRVRAQIDELFASKHELGSVLEEVARLGVRLLLQTALEAKRVPRRSGTPEAEARDGARSIARQSKLPSAGRHRTSLVTEVRNLLEKD